MGNSNSAGVVSASQSSAASILPPPECPRFDSSASNSSSCPVIQDQKPVYNVYNQQINKAAQPESSANSPFLGLRKSDGDVDGNLDPTNNMPVVANQLPAPGQKQVLSTSRVESTIPKGGTAATWVYPSPQMFYNALVRKNKADDVTESDMEHVVSVHNAMNEMTWQTVVQWEKLHYPHTEVESKLLRFRGRPDELSPRARWHVLMGGEAPFDRHDWWIQRGDKEVRYIIDFYYDEAKDGQKTAFVVDTRPALDSVDNVVDRIKMQIYQTAYEYGLPCPITGSPSTFASGTSNKTDM
mmetsp:Transcript_4763/g.5551  ORF Transcript_4763/g.5551 Transcript_4763/m.5551 type:complete len:297 (-) Transcript_4763:176-1066(-)|eukprot:CAMPEP_0197848264 /NCGR_PEP_ID=MMETSP1438-20131217/8102_1 /TAXON_ID=1461541 /ORGANISM="Pterosperma sp., Strain CCMP1384" /LENGTH=296 /DNA_ID=CAMNT_0043460421 /DNA_START=124 /DNA_END=1014 /DNA_ORIENTATION=-